MARAANLKEAFKITGIKLPVNAKNAGEHLMSLYKSNGELTPEIVVRDAKKHSSIMHKCFEWNNAIASDKWRLHQASQIIRCISVVRYADNKKIEVRAFVNIRRDSKNELSHNRFMSKSNGDKSFYVSVSDVMKNDALRKYTVEAALIDLQIWMRKYEAVKELTSFIEKIKTEAIKLKR